MQDFESKAQEEGYNLVIGIDEAGRGPLAGPVVAAAVALKSTQFQNKISDSKKLSPRQREKAFEEIFEKAYIGTGIISESVIDTKNILQATYHAMTIAVEQLIDRIPYSIRSHSSFSNRVCLLIDGNSFKSELPYDYQTVVKGDQSCFSIACASIIAKVTRDRIVQIYDKVFPQYGFGRHKGYPTVAHKQAIKEHGPSIIHRRSFNCV